jgi:hypothetical protein
MGKQMKIDKQKLSINKTKTKLLVKRKMKVLYSDHIAIKMTQLASDKCSGPFLFGHLKL